MTDRSASATEGLARLVAQKRRLLEQLLQTGQRQGELIEAGDITTLLRVLTAKQQLIAALRAVERGLDEFRHEDPEQRVWSSTAHRAACAADTTACRDLLAAVIELEKRHEQTIEQRRDGLADQLRRVQGAHDAAAAYQPHRRPSTGPTTAESVVGEGVVGSLDLSTTG